MLVGYFIAFFYTVMGYHFKKFFKTVFFKLLIVVFLFLSGTVSNAANYTWTRGAGTNNWTDASNWSPVPTSPSYPGSSGGGDNVVFNSPTTAQTIVFPTGTLTLNSLKVNGVFGKVYTLNMTGCSLLINGSFLLLNYTDVSFSNGISVTATDNIFLETVVFGSSISTFASTFIANNISKVGGAALNALPSTFSNQSLQIRNSVFWSTVTTESKAMLFYNNKFRTTATITKKNFASTTIANNSTGNSNNIFYGILNLATEDNISNSGLSWGYNDEYYGVTTITNNSSNLLHIAPVGTASFYNHTYFYSTSGGGITLANISSSSVKFDKGSAVTDSVKVYFYNSGNGFQTIGNGGAVEFNNSKVLLGSTDSRGTTRFAASSVSPVTVRSSSSLNVFSSGSGIPVFSNGRLSLDYVIIEGSTKKTQLYLGCSANIEFKAKNAISRDLLVKSCNYVSFGGDYKGVTQYTNLATAPDSYSKSYDSWKHHNHVSFIHQSSAIWSIGGSGTSPTTSFNSTEVSPLKATVKLETSSTGPLTMGYTFGIINFDDVTLNTVQTTSTVDPGQIQIAANSTVNIGSGSVLKIDQTIGTKGVVLGTPGGSSTPCNLYGTIDATNFLNGIIYFGTFVSKSNFSFLTPRTANSATAVVLHSQVIFEHDATIECQNIASYGGNYLGNTIFHGIAPSQGSRVFIGTHNFSGTTTFLLETGGALLVGYNSGSVFNFNGDVFMKVNPLNGSTKPDLNIPYNGIANFKGNLSYEGDFGTGTIGSNGARCVFNGITDQTIIANTSTTPGYINTLIFTNLEINKPSGKLILASPVRVGKYSSVPGVLVLGKGNMITTPTTVIPTALGSITLGDDATVAGGGKHSYVEGDFTKEGNDAFKFFIGKGIKYFPLSMTAPSTTGASFTAEFTDATQPNSTSFSGTLKDAINCQYWKLDKAGTSTGVDVTLFWNNETTQACYPINHNIVCVARLNSTNWQNEGANILNDYQPADSGYVKSTTSMTSWGYFSLGYRNALVLNTIKANPSLFKVLSHTEPLSTYKFVSGSLGSSAGSLTMLSNTNDVKGKIVIHPDFGSTVDLTIDQNYKDLLLASIDPRADALTYESLKLKLSTNADGSTPVCTLVTATEVGTTYTPLSDQYHSKVTNSVNFFKQRQEDNVYVLSNSLADGITFPVNVSGVTTPFQITNVPTGVTTATLVVKNLAGATLYTTMINPLSWDGKVSGVYVAEGVYTYVLTLNVSSQNYIYNGQLIVKYQ